MPEPTLRKRVPEILTRRLKRLRKCSHDALASGAPEDLHATRIVVKRLRYELEFFRATLGPEADHALELLAHVQERLGTIADADAFERLYVELAVRLPPGDVRTRGLAARRDAVARDRTRALDALRELWRGSGSAYGEKLAASISAALGSLSPNDAG